MQITKSLSAKSTVNVMDMKRTQRYSANAWEGITVSSEGLSNCPCYGPQKEGCSMIVLGHQSGKTLTSCP